MTIWEITSALSGARGVDLYEKLLAAGWEPYAVDGGSIHFRREVPPAPRVKGRTP